LSRPSDQVRRQSPEGRSRNTDRHLTRRNGSITCFAATAGKCTSAAEIVAKAPTLLIAGDFVEACCAMATHARSRPDMLGKAPVIWIQRHHAETRAGVGDSLADALFAAAQHWRLSLHLNKGLAGAPAEAIEAARHTAMNPAVLDAFALIISAAEGPPAHPGVPGREPDVSAARSRAAAVGRAMDEVRKLLPNVGSYVAEGDFFDAAWRQSFWGPNYAKLLAVKDKYDPDGLFFVHHGVGSERWSPDGFTRLE
jgi:Berberine and berberine like